MNAQSTVHRQSPRAAAAQIVNLFVPGISEPERDLRVRIYLAGLKAQAKEPVSAEAARVYADAAMIANRWWRERGAKAAELEEVIRIFGWLALAAGAIERLETPDAE